jgi:hypothetical protein
MSMSVQRDERVPNPVGVWMVAKELGFVGEMRPDNVTMWLEDLDGHGQAVNVVQLLDPQGAQ